MRKKYKASKKQKKEVQKKRLKSRFLDRLVEALTPAIGNLCVLIITLLVGGYYFHNIYEFNSDKREVFKSVRKDLSKLRNKINKLSAVVKHGARNTDLNAYRKEEKSTANDIIRLEIKIINEGDWSYYFGEDVAQKGAYFILWSNQVTKMVLKHEYYPPDKVTDLFYASIVYAMQTQLYSPYHCSQCLFLSKIKSGKILPYVSTFDPKYPVSKLIHIQAKLSYTNINSLQLLINGIGSKA
jgi:hypothetical protein